MRRRPIIPRIIKIEKKEEYIVICTFNNGQRKKLNFQKIFADWNVSTDDAEGELLNIKSFQKVQLRNGTLSWPNVPVTLITEAGEEVEHPYQLSPDVLFELGENIEPTASEKFGSLIRSARIKAGLTQEQLAQRSGTTRFYISRLENDRTDVELSTFRKIVEAGLGRRFTLKIE